ncbi:MAG TPA: bifunctional diaminohydroxyphosphoribosylaminopyrimidine deaminase/5-amino-6-(5-phosphoribosylamino)uracil reductase RibD [Spongiibacteraceae bacterium]
MTADIDHHYMAEALQLAERGLYTTSPNPRVGCVLVRDGKIIGRGWHQWAGQPHAEINALHDAQKLYGNARGATAYVTLEPCSHHGKTAPCCAALIAAGITRVVAAMKDPNPLVSGRGLELLRNAGIAVATGLLENAARALNVGFISRMERQRPWVRVKLAMSLDGRTAMASGESQWLTGTAARADGQRLRARSCAIVSGVETILLDNAALSVRAEELNLPNAEEIARRQPLRVVLDSQLRLHPPARIFAQPGRLTIATLNDEQKRWEQIIDAGGEIFHAPAHDGRVDLNAVMNYLTEQQCNEVLVEAGPTLAGAFWRAGLVDWLTIYMAPTLLGSTGKPLFELPLEKMRAQQRLKIHDIRAVGNDWRIDATPLYATPPAP